MRTISIKKFLFADLVALTIVMVGIGLALALSSPPDELQGDFARIFHVHVPVAWIAFLAFAVTATGSVGWLLTRNLRWDLLAEASAEIGVVFTGVAIITGSLWGRPVWGTFWDWGDKRLATTALMFFVYLGYLALRRATDDPIQRARRSALLGVVAVVQVPLVYFSVNLWRTLHPAATIRPDGVQMGSEMLRAFLVNLLAFNLVFVVLLILRVRLGRTRLRSAAQDLELAGAAVEPPRLERL